MSYQYIGAGSADVSSITISLWAYVTTAAINAALDAHNENIPLLVFGKSTDSDPHTFAGATAPHTYNRDVGAGYSWGGLHGINNNFDNSIGCAAGIGESGVIWTGVPSSVTDENPDVPGPPSDCTFECTPSTMSVTCRVMHGLDTIQTLSLDISSIRASRGSFTVAASGITSADSSPISMASTSGGIGWNLTFDIPSENIYEPSQPRQPSALILHAISKSISFVSALRMPDADNGSDKFDFAKTNEFSGNSDTFVPDSWNHVYFNWDGSSDGWHIIVNNDVTSYPYGGGWFDGPAALEGLPFGIPIIPDEIDRNYTVGNNQAIKLAFVQVWVNNSIDPTPENLAKFFTRKLISGQPRLVPPADDAAQKAFGRSDIWAYRRKSKKKLFTKNLGTAGDFTTVGGGLSDFFPGPGQ